MGGPDNGTEHRPDGDHLVHGSMEETGGRTGPEVGQGRVMIILCGFDASTALYAVSVLTQ